MSRYIIVHRENLSDLGADLKYVGALLNVLSPDGFNNDDVRHLITSRDGRVVIDFRCGNEPDRFAGVWPEYWMSDLEDIARIIEQGACKRNGKRLTTLDQVAMVAAYSYFHEREIDSWVGL